MYTDLKSVSILISLLKQYQIEHIVISAGTRHIPFVFSVEQDNYFKTYSVVDERSASFFALGIIEKIQKPVAIVCTSGTAACNYVSAVNEAFYQKLPLVVLTADRNQYYLNQQEEQMVMQDGLYGRAVKKTVTLPIVRDEKDAWYCSRLVNEALLELNHGETGPVHINFPVEDNYPTSNIIFSFKTRELEKANRISRLDVEDDLFKWKKKVEQLRKAKVLIIYGQHGKVSADELSAINRFCKVFNCIFCVDLLSNMVCDKAIFTYASINTISTEKLESILPDIVITMNGHTVSAIKAKLKGYSDRFKHWHISADGVVSDPFKVQTDIIACMNKTFFNRFAELAEEMPGNDTDSYYQQWKDAILASGNGLSPNECDFKFSSIYAVQQIMKMIPEGSLLHLANSNSVRIANYFSLKKEIEVYANRGTHGIDGSMSSFIGQASVSSELCYLIIGDLSFFYDMNAFWNRYVGNNVRILINNNSGGGIFHAPYYQQGEEFERIDQHIAAGHHTSVKSWAEAVGFKYFGVSDKKQMQDALKEFNCRSDKPIIIETFTNMDVDITQMAEVTHQTKGYTQAGKFAASIPEPAKRTLKKLLGR